MLNEQGAGGRADDGEQDAGAAFAEHDDFGWAGNARWRCQSEGGLEFFGAEGEFGGMPSSRERERDQSAAAGDGIKRNSVEAGGEKNGKRPDRGEGKGAPEFMFRGTNVRAAGSRGIVA